jgi:phosphatidylethanolamine-binding protein (PEBP) family uncharacterized protein
MKLSGRIQTRAAKTLVAPALVVGLAFVGCGGSSTQSSPSQIGPSSGQSYSASISTSTSALPPQTSRRSEPAVTIETSIPGLLAENRIPTRYTCDGADVSLPVRWSAIPPGTAELAMFVASLQPVHGSEFFNWAVTDLKPTSHGISAGALPPGAVVGRNSFGKVGYSICPARGTHEDYLVRVIALPHPLAAQPGFNAHTLFLDAERISKVVGLTGGKYERP